MQLNVKLTNQWGQTRLIGWLLIPEPFPKLTLPAAPNPANSRTHSAIAKQ